MLTNSPESTNIFKSSTTCKMQYYVPGCWNMWSFSSGYSEAKRHNERWRWQAVEKTLMLWNSLALASVFYSFDSMQSFWMVSITLMGGTVATLLVSVLECQSEWAFLCSRHINAEVDQIAPWANPRPLERNFKRVHTKLTLSAASSRSHFLTRCTPPCSLSPQAGNLELILYHSPSPSTMNDAHTRSSSVSTSSDSHHLVPGICTSAPW